MAEKRLFPNPLGNVVLTGRGIRISHTWLHLEEEAEGRSPKLGARIRGMRKREESRLLLTRIDDAVDDWQRQHPGEAIPWQIGG